MNYQKKKKIKINYKLVGRVHVTIFVQQGMNKPLRTSPLISDTFV